MKVVKLFLTILGAITLSVIALSITAQATRMFTVQVHASAGRQNEGYFNLSVWRCTQDEQSLISYCRGITLNEDGAARTYSSGGRVHQ